LIYSCVLQLKKYTWLNI
ncbi:hypothetical protein, partial [Plasmodium yoelii yoelii]